METEKEYETPVVGTIEVPEQEVKPIIGGTIEAPDKRRLQTTAKTLVFTCAQSNTRLHDGFFNALLGYCKSRDAELHISRFTYNKASFGKNSVKPDTEQDSDDQAMWFDERIEPYISDDSLEITPDLVWCGELNILPTRVNPISGFQNYTRSASCIIPHAKMFMQSVPTMFEQEPKSVFTTGAVTQRNYIQKAAGQKADFHHVFGAIVVEVDEDGTWWARQLNAQDDGTFHDIDRKYKPNGKNVVQKVQAITHGDLHGYKLNMDIIEQVFGKGNVMDKLKPREQFFHDTIDFMPRNHHNMKDPVHAQKMWRLDTDNVEGEFSLMGKLLATTLYRKDCKSFIVVSNHDQAFNNWLDNPAALQDPPNLVFWHRKNAERLHRCIEDRYSPFTSVILEKFNLYCKNNQEKPTFLLEHDSYKILGEIEAALHGHKGPSGSRGSPRNLGVAGKVNSAHTHAPGIYEGVYTCGVYGNLDMGYNRGMGAWSHTFTVTYANAKRALYTIKKGKAWR